MFGFDAIAPRPFGRVSTQGDATKRGAMATFYQFITFGVVATGGHLDGFSIYCGGFTT